jgi:DNA-binding CsgD family transcriptional regulator
MEERVFLRDGDLSRCRAVLAALLSAPSHSTVEEWADDVLLALTDLFGGCGSFLLLPSAGGGGGPRVYSPDLEPGCVERLQSFVSADPHSASQGDPQHTRAMGRLAGMGVQVFNQESVEHLTRVRLRDMSRFYPEVMLDGEVSHFGTAALWLPDGPVLLSCLCRASRPARLADQELEVLSLLAPALETAVWVVRSLADRGGAIGRLLDEFDTPALLRCDDGLSCQNRSLGDLLETAEDPRALVTAMTSLAAELMAMGERARKTTTATALPSGARAIVIAGRRYRFQGSWLRPGTVGPGPAALVLVRGATRRLPDVRDLGDRYGLTGRQAQVARLLALGASNEEIALRLGISAHTARHHAQSVLERVGTRSRKAIGLRFLEEACAPW